MRTRYIVPVALALLATVCANAFAEPPRTFAFQGVLTTPAGAYVADGSYSLTFRLYGDLTGGSALWTESKSVTTSKGRFTTALGDTTSFPSIIHWGDDDYFVSIQVAADAEATPRVPLIGVPYALGLPGVTVAIGGNVGIGTDSPGHKLDVNGDINASGSLRELGIPLPSRYAFINGSNATGTWPVNIGGSAPAGSLSGVVPIAKGGTGTSSSPGAAGQYLRSTGAGAWAPGTIAAGDLPGLSASYMDLTTNQTAAGVKVFSDKVGVRNSSPTYALDVSGVIRTTSGLIYPDGTIQLSAGWAVAGNAGLTPGTHFLGTTDATPLEVRVNNTTGLRLYSTPSTPNLVGGYLGNAVPIAQGAVIAGGGRVNNVNRVLDDFGSLVGGMNNTVGDDDGKADHAPYAFVGGGAYNTAGAESATVAGGDANQALGLWSTVPGGLHNVAQGESSQAAGRQAKALHKGAFVWGDSTPSDFVSTGLNQFLVRASGGAGINTNAPRGGTGLDVNGVVGSQAGGIMFPDNTIQLTAAVASADWKLVGNAGTNPGVNFVGTTDNKALELKVNAARALRIEPAASPNLIGGYFANAVNPAAVQGALVGGGGKAGALNIVSDDYGFVGGGTGNTAGNADGTANNAPNTTVAGGDANKAFDAFTTVGGGQTNTAGDTANPGVGSHQTVGGGWTNTAAGSKSTIGGGQFNQTLAAGTYSVVAGGAQNQTAGPWSAVGGGQANVASGQHATVPGGASNTAAGTYSLAAGRQAVAQHQGAFVWSDSAGVPFLSTGVDQFLIRAAGGVGINTNALIAGVTLDVNGLVRSRSGGYMFPDNTIQLTAAVASADWKLVGNAGTVFGTNFVGTTDGAALDLRVNNTSALQLWPVPGGTPNIRGGYALNVGSPPAQGIFLGGGGYAGAVPHPNVVYDDFGVLGGGADNTIGLNDGNPAKQHYSTIAGGQGNTVSDALASILGGDHNTASQLYATAVGGAQNTASGNASFVGGGRQNQAQGMQSFVGGGGMNLAAGQQSTVAGGDTNLATGLQATIAGGWMNKAVDPNTTVGGGQTNVAGNPAALGTGNHATVGGGVGNQATGGWSTIPGGNLNTASGNYSFAAGDQAGALHSGAWVWADNQAGPALPFNSTGANQFLIRAQGNVGINTNLPTSMLDVNGQIRTRVGGVMFPDGTVQLTAAGGPAVPGWSLTGNAGTVPGTNFLGTTDNNLLELRVNSTHALRLEPTAGTPVVIGGFKGNAVYNGAQGAAIASGGVLSAPNTVGEDYGFIGGGSGNSINDGDGIPTTSPNAVVAGGHSNRAMASYATVGGGQYNGAGPWAAVPGGQENTAAGPFTAIGGGQLNQAMGPHSTIPGGLQNQAPAPNSLAAGTMAIAAHPGAFVWADSAVSLPAPVAFMSVAQDEFAARAVGGVRFVTAVTPLGIPTAGARLPAGGSAWLAISDRNAKENFAAIDPVEVLQRLAAIPIETWNYKTQDASIRHMGPMAQDFSAAFGIGEDEKHISTIDADGVALAAAQGLYKLLQEKEARITALEVKNADLERRLSALEARFGPR